MKADLVHRISRSPFILIALTHVSVLQIYMLIFGCTLNMIYLLHGPTRRQKDQPDQRTPKTQRSMRRAASPDGKARKTKGPRGVCVCVCCVSRALCYYRRRTTSEIESMLARAICSSGVHVVVVDEVCTIWGS